VSDKNTWPQHYIRIRGYIRGYIPTSRIFDADISPKISADISPRIYPFFWGIYPPRGYIRGYIPKGGYIPQKKGYILGDISSGIYPRKGIYPFPKGIYPTLKRIGYIPERGYIPFPKGIYLTLKRIGYVCGLGYIRDISPHSRGYIT
jgi:hypothetical protein